MNKFYLTLVVLLLAIFSLSSQNYNKDFTYKLNSGWGFLGNGDLPTFSLENEFAYIINHYK